jgi:hypothetical protein
MKEKGKIVKERYQREKDGGQIMTNGDKGCHLRKERGEIVKERCEILMAIWEIIEL